MTNAGGTRSKKRKRGTGSKGERGKIIQILNTTTIGEHIKSSQLGAFRVETLKSRKKEQLGKHSISTNHQTIPF